MISLKKEIEHLRREMDVLRLDVRMIQNEIKDINKTLQRFLNIYTSHNKIFDS